MKTLFVIRHAKSSWSFDLDDHDRPLGRRGRKDVFKVGAKLKETYQNPERILSSTASRAFYTALFIADAWKMDESEIQLAPALFHASSEQILKVMQQTADCSTLAFTGHNPGITDFVNRVGDKTIENLPTCGVAIIELPIEKWSQLRFGMGSIKAVHVPKQL